MSEHSLQDNQVINISQMYYGTLQRFKSKNLQGHFHSSFVLFKVCAGLSIILAK
jgi:hypothetical protein